jgi:hypothetical protein
MFRIFYANKDASLYEAYPNYNTGLDEILEVGKRLGTDGSTLLKSRAIVKFDMTEVSASLSKYSKSVTDCKFVLQLYTAQAKALPAEYSINAKMLGQDWVNGIGYLSDLETSGVSWDFVDSGSAWISGSQKQQIGTSRLYISGSGAGGNYLYYSGSGTAPVLTTSESFSYQTTDINIDVTNQIRIWISGSNNNSIPNYGFLIQLSDSDEANNNVQGYIRYFSRETHTIYVPKLTMYWDNSAFTTGSMAAVDLESYLIYSNVKPTYNDTEISKIRIYARDKYPRKSPTNLFPIETVKYLPTTTYYSVLDAATDEVIIPYDNIYTKVSCDSTSNYIYIDMNGFMPERYYRLQLKIVDGITEQYIDDQIYFKVVR